MANFLIESALLTHGLASISDAEIIRSWHDGWRIAWLSDGRPVTGDAEEFCRFRDRAAGFRRINWFTYDSAKAEGASGPLTASGALRACMETGTQFAVSCGLGGLRTGEGPEKSNDIMALKELCSGQHSAEHSDIEQCDADIMDKAQYCSELSNTEARGPEKGCVGLIATAFKDMFDAEHAISVARMEGVSVFRLTDDWHAGYMFADRSDVESDGNDSLACTARPGTSDTSDRSCADRASLVPGKADTLVTPGLYLVPISGDLLIPDRTILEEAIRYGTEQARQGKAFHPAVNRRIDELTGGYSSQLQLRSLIENIKLAEIK